MNEKSIVYIAALTPELMEQGGKGVWIEER